MSNSEPRHAPAERSGGGNGGNGGNGGGTEGGDRRPPRRGGRRGGGGGRKQREIDVPPVTPEALERLAATLDDGDYCVFDIETTGGNPEKNGITEIFAIRLTAGEIKGTFYSLVNPGIPIPPIVRRMTGIDNKMVRNSPRIDEVMPDLLKFVGDAIFVSHNTIGDMKFVRHFAKTACAVELENFYLCTHLLVEKLAPEAPDKSLRGLAEHFKLGSGELHRAEADAYVTLDLFKVLLGRLKERSVRRIAEAVRLQGDLESAMRLGWGVKVLAPAPPGPGVVSLFDHERRLLFVSSAMHLDREVAKLRTLNQLPRQLLRLVLRTYDLQTQSAANGYAALLAECEILERSGGVPFAPAGWHQRIVQTLFLAEDGGGLRLGIGQLEEGTRYAYGPVRDRRIASEVVDQIAAAYDVKPGRFGPVLPKEAEPQILALLNGTLEAEYAATVKRRRAISLWFKPRERQELARRAALLKRLVDIKLPNRFSSLLDRAGVLLAADGQGGWQGHRIVQSRPAGLAPLTGSTNTAPGTVAPEAVTALARDVAAATAAPLSALAANEANATLWWLYNGKAESRFVSLGALQGGPEAVY